MKTGRKGNKRKEVIKPRKAYNKLIAIRGLVIPVAWDEKGNVVATAISTHNEEEYVVENVGKGGELISLIREEVEVSGVVRTEQSKKIIRVKKYQKYGIE